MWKKDIINEDILFGKSTKEPGRERINDEEIKMERDILKKAVSIFSKPSK